MDKEERDSGNRERKRWLCNEREDLAGEGKRETSIPAEVRESKEEGGGSGDN